MRVPGIYRFTLVREWAADSCICHIDNHARHLPKWVLFELSSSSSNGAPLAAGGVDSKGYTLLQTLVHHALDEVDIVLMVGRPVLGTLNINPEHA